MVRERAAAERAHQARARPAPLPRQVPAAARRGADSTALSRRAGSSWIRSAGRARRSWRPSGSAATPSAATSRASTRCSRARRRASTTRRRSPRGLEADARARTSARGRSAASRPTSRPISPSGTATEARRELLAYRRAIEPGHGLGGPRLARADSRRALGAPRPPRRARCGARARARALLVPQAPPHLPADHRRAALPAPLLERRRGARSRRSRHCDRRARGPTCTTSTCAISSSSGPPTPSSPRRPTSGVIDYHDQHAYAYALLELTPRTEAEIGSRSRGAGARAVRAYADDMVAALSTRRDLPAARRAARDRRQRPPRALRRHPRARRPAARVARAAPRQPAHEPSRRRVLRGDPRRAARLVDVRRRGPRGARAPRSRAGGSRTAARSRRRS